MISCLVALGKSGSGTGIAFQCDHRRKSIRDRRHRLVGKIHQDELLTTVENILHLVALTGTTDRVDHHIATHARRDDDPSVLGLMGWHGLAVDRDSQRAVSLYTQREDASVCSVHQPQPNPLAGADGELVLHGSVHRHRIADAARMCDVWVFPKVSLTCPLSVMRQSSSTQVTSRCTVRGCRSSTIRIP